MDPLIQALVTQFPTFIGLVWLGVSLQAQVTAMRAEAKEDREFMKQLIFLLLADQGISPQEAQQKALGIKPQ